MKRIARGEPARLPSRYEVHLVAARYGMTLDAVRAMPADDFLDALNLLPITGSGR